MSRALGAAVVGIALATAATATVAPSVLASSSAPAGAGKAPGPAVPAAAAPRPMSLQVDQGSLSLPTLVPGESGVVKVVVINPNPAPVAVTSIRGQVSGLHPSCAEDIRLGVMSDAGQVLARSGGRHEFGVPITFVQDAARLQDCQNDSYRIDFTVTGSGK